MTFTIGVAIFFMLVGSSAAVIQNPKNYDNYYVNHYNENSSTVLIIHKILKPSAYYTKYIAQVFQVNNQKTNGKILLNILKDSIHTPLQVGDQLFLKPKFLKIPKPLNPYQFNYKEYLAKQHIYQQIFITKNEYHVVGKRRFSLTGISAKVRTAIQNSLRKHHFSTNEFAVINALLLGQRQEISKELLEDYTNAGAIHILAISGLHIGILLWILSFLLKPIEQLRNGKLLKTILLVFLLWSFAFIAGLSASVVRAVTMFTFVAIALSLNRKQLIEHSLITSMFVLLLANPMFLFDVGFQLSYLAVFGIVWVQPLLYKLWKPKFMITNKLWQLLTVSVAAQAGILPISLYYFHQFPSLFIISNLVIIPFLGGILIGGILIILLSLTNILPSFLADLYGSIITLMNNFVGWISNQEDFLFKELSLSPFKMLAWYLSIILCYQLFMNKKSKHLLRFLVTVIILQLVYTSEEYFKNNKEEFIVFHKNRKTIIGQRNGKNLKVYHSLNKNKTATERTILSYKINQSVSTVFDASTPNIFQFKSSNIIVVDSLGVYNIAIENPIVILQHSPKINLTKLIKTVNPKQIVADGSNYKSYINRWEATCSKQKTPFHYTGQNGALLID